MKTEGDGSCAILRNLNLRDSVTKGVSCARERKTLRDGYLGSFSGCWRVYITGYDQNSCDPSAEAKAETVREYGQQSRKLWTVMLNVWGKSEGIDEPIRSESGSTLNPNEKQDVEKIV